MMNNLFKTKESDNSELKKESDKLVKYIKEKYKELDGADGYIFYYTLRKQLGDKLYKFIAVNNEFKNIDDKHFELSKKVELGAMFGNKQCMDVMCEIMAVEIRDGLRDYIKEIKEIMMWGDRQW